MSRVGGIPAVHGGEDVNAGKLTPEQFFATAKPGDRFVYHAADPNELPPPSCVMTVTSVTAEDVAFRFPPAYLTQYGVTTSAFSLGEHAGVDDRFEIVEA
jgi:hypothetical protein